MAFFNAGGVRLYLGVAEKPEFDRTSILYFRVADIRAAERELEARGVRFTVRAHKTHEDASHELWLAFFGDSEGIRWP